MLRKCTSRICEVPNGYLAVLANVTLKIKPKDTSFWNPFRRIAGWFHNALPLPLRQITSEWISQTFYHSFLMWSKSADLDRSFTFFFGHSSERNITNGSQSLKIRIWLEHQQSLSAVLPLGLFGLLSACHLREDENKEWKPMLRYLKS